MMRFHEYFRSSAAYRVRIALELKGVAHESVPVDLRSGEQHAETYAAINPQRLVPALEDGNVSLRQSLAICEYLDEAYPRPALLPAELIGRARVRALAQLIACDVHPLNNLRVLRYLDTELDAGDARKKAWYQHWIREGFRALESMLAADPQTARYCHGNRATLADLCLVPQVFNAKRFGVNLAHYRHIRRINDACLELEAFDHARPERQPDAPSDHS